MGKTTFQPWPLGIMIVYGSFASVMIGFVIWSTRHKVDLVAPDYYAQEIAYQQEIDARERSMPYQNQVRWHHGDGDLEIELLDPLRSSITHGQLRLYRPSDSALDHDVPLTLDPGGRFTLDTSNLKDGFWRARLEWKLDEQNYAIATSFSL